MESPEQIGGKDFIKDNISLSNLSKGDFVSVEEFKVNKEKQSDEKRSVIKEYDLSSIDDLFRDKNLSLEEKAHILKRRQEFTQKFYSDLPSVVVKSQFILGRGSNNQSTIFEVQDKVNDYYTTDEDGKIVRELNIQQKENLVRELEYFITRTYDFLNQKDEAFPESYDEYHSFFPDVHVNNLVVTSECHLRIIYTNMYKHLWEEDSTYEDCERRLNELKQIKERIGVSLKTN